MTATKITWQNIDEVPIPCWGFVEYWGGAKPGHYWHRYTERGMLICDYQYCEDATVSYWHPDQPKAPEGRP